MKKGILATSSTEQGIIKLISEYYYGSTISLVTDGDRFLVCNLKGEIKGVTVIKKNNRFIFMEEQVS